MPIRILVADDHQATRTAIASLVRNSGQDWEICGEAEDGQAAVEKAAELKPDLLIIDLMMPQRDGISAGRAIRAQVPTVSVLLYTLWVSEFLQAEARAAGLQAVVQKSNAASLLSAIREAVAHRDSSPSDGGGPSAFLTGPRPS
ncbi:MAG TPA: response regulator transcription factor [Candidatus Acidoferrales bacterium]|nr:response regulator transcription factor [Candidatus Acidoferrales bacterium]